MVQSLELANLHISAIIKPEKGIVVTIVLTASPDILAASLIVLSDNQNKSVTVMPVPLLHPAMMSQLSLAIFISEFESVLSADK